MALKRIQKVSGFFFYEINDESKVFDSLSVFEVKEEIM